MLRTKNKTFNLYVS